MSPDEPEDPTATPRVATRPRLRVVAPPEATVPPVRLRAATPPDPGAATPIRPLRPVTQLRPVPPKWPHPPLDDPPRGAA